MVLTTPTKKKVKVEKDKTAFGFAEHDLSPFKQPKLNDG